MVRINFLTFDPMPIAYRNRYQPKIGNAAAQHQLVETIDHVPTVLGSIPASGRKFISIVGSSITPEYYACKLGVLPNLPPIVSVVVPSEYGIVRWDGISESEGMESALVFEL